MFALHFNRSCLQVNSAMNADVNCLRMTTSTINPNPMEVLFRILIGTWLILFDLKKKHWNYNNRALSGYAMKDIFQPSLCILSPSETNCIPSSSQLPFCSFSVPSTESSLLFRPNTKFDFYKLTLFNELIFFLYVKSNLRGNAKMSDLGTFSMHLEWEPFIWHSSYLRLLCSKSLLMLNRNP